MLILFFQVVSLALLIFGRRASATLLGLEQASTWKWAYWTVIVVFTLGILFGTQAVFHFLGYELRS